MNQKVYNTVVVAKNFISDLVWDGDERITTPLGHTVLLRQVMNLKEAPLLKVAILTVMSAGTFVESFGGGYEFMMPATRVCMELYPLVERRYKTGQPIKIWVNDCSANNDAVPHPVSIRPVYMKRKEVS